MIGVVGDAEEVRLLGRSAAIRAVEADIDWAARSDAKVLITGETGVGKEVMARLIHHKSARAAGALVTLNCAGIADSLLESELFGHVRGSFTDAYRDKPGLFEMAPNGTVFLDEVGEMSARMQAVLLRFLESGEIRRVGSASPSLRVNVRLITATNRDLATQMASGAFREDLFFRLNVIRLSMPPLRERSEDIPAFVNFFLRGYSKQHTLASPGIGPEAMAALTAYRWPGNVRELKNVMERIALKAAGAVIGLADLPREVSGSSSVDTEVVLGAMACGDSPAHALAAAMLDRSQSFWSIVHPLFMSRDLTRHDLRLLIQIGLRQTNGNYRQLVELFNMHVGDYRRFLSFLRQHDCHVPFKSFRPTRGALAPTATC